MKTLFDDESVNEEIKVFAMGNIDYVIELLENAVEYKEKKELSEEDTMIIKQELDEIKAASYYSEEGSYSPDEVMDHWYSIYYSSVSTTLDINDLTDDISELILLLIPLISDILNLTDQEKQSKL
jgi:hypothetical protein